MKFTKHGSVRYIGHLDMQRYFQRVNRRAGLKVIYSEGFSPHQKMSFAMPLSVGYESDAEYFDLEVSEAESSSYVIDAMNREQAEGIKVTDCVLLPEKCENAMASVRAADYIIGFREGYEPPFDMASAIEELEKSDVFTVKKPAKKKKRSGRISKASYNTKTMGSDTHQGNTSQNPSGRGEDEAEYSETDIRPYIYRIKIGDDGCIHMQVSAGSKANVKPEPVLKAVYKKKGFELPGSALLITRHELYTCAGDGESLIPLSQAGEAF